MKAVMLAVQPKWCEKIANEEKKVEVRKTAPKRADCITCPFEYYEPRKRVSSCDAYLKRPPQSWQYVEELQE